MPTLYDNFERVRQYIDQHQADVDLSSYVSKDELSGCGYITNEVTQLDGPLFISYQTVNNGQYTLNAYSHIIAGTEDKTGVSLIATKRKCGGDEGTSYMASFFTNSDGRSKFAHKTKVSETEVGVQYDDAFMCFNAYGFRIAYSGTEGVSATTEYEILHEGNIGNLGYVTSSDLPVINENIVPKETATYTLGDGSHLYKTTYSSALYVNGNARIYNDNGGISLRVADYSSVRFGGTTVAPQSNNSKSLGTSSMQWKETYTYNLYTETAYLNDTSYTKSIVPSENNSYTLGDSSYMYSTAYVSDLWTSGKNRISNRSDNQINIQLNNGWKYTFHTNGFSGASTGMDLGNVKPWRSTYTTNLYADTAYLNDTSYSSSIVPKESAAYTLGDASHLYNAAYSQNVKGVQRIFFPNGSSLAINNTAGNASSDRYTFSSSEFKPNATGNISLGTSTAKWGATYTANLYADTIHNLIWTGTSAEYALLDNYTTYQIYMIKEA